MDVVSLQQEYDEIHVRLSVLYEEADLIMNENKEVSLLKKTLNALKDAHLSMQHLSAKAIGIVDTDERAILPGGPLCYICSLLYARVDVRI